MSVATNVSGDNCPQWKTWSIIFGIDDNVSGDFMRSVSCVKKVAFRFEKCVTGYFVGE